MHCSKHSQEQWSTSHDFAGYKVNSQRKLYTQTISRTAKTSILPAKNAPHHYFCEVLQDGYNHISC